MNIHKVNMEPLIEPTYKSRSKLPESQRPLSYMLLFPTHLPSLLSLTIILTSNTVDQLYCLCTYLSFKIK